MPNMTNKQYAELMSFLREMKEEQVLAQQALEERLLERIKRLEINMKSRLLSFEETAMLNSIHTSAAPVAHMLVGGPFAHNKPQTKDSPVTAVQDLLGRVFSSLSDSQINDKYEAMGKKCLNACKGYAATGDHMGRPWRDISPMDKLIICRAATDNLKDSEGNWSFLDNCEGLGLLNTWFSLVGPTCRKSSELKGRLKKLKRKKKKNTRLATEVAYCQVQEE